MDKELIRQMLPEEPRPGLLNWAKKNCKEDLGARYMTWKRETINIYSMEYLMGCDTKAYRRERVARCTCLCCGSQFVTEITGSILMFWIDECGEWWGLDPSGQQPFEDEDTVENGYMVEIHDGDDLVCPMCHESVRLIQGKNLRGGRRKQILVPSIEVVGEYAAVVYWMVRREIFEDHQEYFVYPKDAYVLDEKGVLHRYCHESGGGYSGMRNSGSWRLTSSRKDSLDSVYHDWGSWNNKKKGGAFYEIVPDLDGTTGEKTGLQAFSGYDGLYSVEYLKLWRKYPHLENLVNTGWTRLVNRIVKSSFEGHDLKAEMEKVVDITKCKPFEMLGMSKRDFKEIRKHGWQWDFDAQLLYRSSSFCTALDFQKYRKLFTDTGIRAVGELYKRYGDKDFEKIQRYLEKQDMRPSEVGILLDTRNAAKCMAGNRPLTTEELWPRNLQATHDRLTRARLVQIDHEKARQYQRGFDAVLERYSELQWSDGELCIVIPKSYGDLVREGEVLRHCVGGYSEDHIRGEHTIFFVRHYRKPERCYYTLDINMMDRPYRQQLHGYGNERHGINKQYKHKIPKKVLDFCSRWEREILMPWYRRQQTDQKNKEKTA